MKEISLIKVFEVGVLIGLWYLFNLLHKAIFGYPAGFLGVMILFIAIYFIVLEK